MRETLGLWLNVRGCSKLQCPIGPSAMCRSCERLPPSHGRSPFLGARPASGAFVGGHDHLERIRTGSCGHLHHSLYGPNSMRSNTRKKAISASSNRSVLSLVPIAQPRRPNTPQIGASLRPCSLSGTHIHGQVAHIGRSEHHTAHAAAEEHESQSGLDRIFRVSP